jgi:hypothetical protein
MNSKKKCHYIEIVAESNNYGFLSIFVFLVKPMKNLQILKVQFEDKLCSYTYHLETEKKRHSSID